MSTVGVNANASKWMQGDGKESDIVISSRIRLARNLAGYSFPHLLNHEQAMQVVEKVASVFANLPGEEGKEYDMLYMQYLPSLDRQVLVEKHLISPQLAEKEEGALLLSKGEDVAIMLNEEDHLRMQCLLPGLQLEVAWQKLNKIDDMLEEKLDIAFDNQFGYLTACPTNLGTGLRASVMLHLPALVFTKQADQLFSVVNKVGMTVRGLYGEGTKAGGNMFQLSNQVTLGLTEEEILSRLNKVVMQVIEQEKQARIWLQKENDKALADRIWRAYGILTNARSISSDEMMEKCSLIRLGMDLGILPNLNSAMLNRIMVGTQPAFVQKKSVKELDPQERDWQRAEMIRKQLRGEEL